MSTTTAAQPTLPSLVATHQNHYLFSDYYLNHVVRDRPEWRSAVAAAESAAALARIAAIWERFQPQGDNEQQTELELIRPVLDALGHQYNVQVPIETPLGTRFPDYILFPDDAARLAAKGIAVATEAGLAESGAIAVADAKAWELPLDRPIRQSQQKQGLKTSENPSFQIDFYVRHTGLPWGILTNGRHWRLYHRDSSKKLDVYYEVDLPHLIEQATAIGAGAAEREAFGYFYLFFRRQAFGAARPQHPVAESWLDAVLAESRVYAQGIGEDLKVQVYEALRVLAQGFLDFRTNGLEDSDDALKEIYDNSLILLYRLLFTLYAEDRGLLPVQPQSIYRQSYSLLALKRSVAADLDRGVAAAVSMADVWPKLRSLWRLIDQGNDELGVPAYNGGLFNPEKHPFLETYQVGDHHLRQAIDLLARAPDPRTGRRAFVDYRDLDVRHLGSIYEGLLEYRLHRATAPLAVNRAQGREAYVPATDSAPAAITPGEVYLTTEKGERKLTGSYYTPDDLVQYIVEHTIGPILANLQTRHADDPPALRQAILRLNVLDPAIGSGHFLVAATDFVARFMVAAALPEQADLGEEAELAYWRRRVAQSCIYGVDLNPLAVELAKLSLWLATVAKDRPLSFLDHHLRVGNSLIGWPLAQLPLEGPAAKPSRARSGTAASGTATAGKAASGQLDSSVPLQQSMLSDSTFAGSMRSATRYMLDIESLRGDSLAEVQEAERIYLSTVRAQTAKPRLLADVWTARQLGLALDDARWKGLRDHILHGGFALPQYAAILDETARLAAAHRLFHWELEFPDVFMDEHGALNAERGGFDAVVGNPPWERIKLQEVEFFAARSPAIAKAQTAAARKRAVADLSKSDPTLLAVYATAKKRAEDDLRFMQRSGLYPLMGRGDTNLYAVFAERATQLVAPTGRVGLLVPSGIATDHTTRFFIQKLVDERRLAELIDFENRDGIFADVHRSFKFSIVLMTGAGDPQTQVRAGFFLHQLAELADRERTFDLEPDDFARFNPNTRTAPIFRRRRDYELTRKIYENVPVLVDQSKAEIGNPWGISFLRMFDMTNDSHLFRSSAELEADGFWLGAGNVYTKGASRYLPLYEGKMVQLYDHRAASVVVNPENLHRPAVASPSSISQLDDPNYLTTPQFWIGNDDILRGLTGAAPRWLLGYKDVTSPTNVRTMIPAIIPFSGVGNTLCLIMLNEKSPASCLLANLSSFVLDFVARQKVGGQHLNFFIVEQLPVLPPTRYDSDFHGVHLVDFISRRVLELCYTAHDLRGFAEDMGYDGPPFPWDEERRLHLRCQLDALYFHLYELTRNEAGEVMDTFPIVKRQDQAKHGRFRTRELVLAYYNAYGAGNMDAWVKG